MKNSNLQHFVNIMSHKGAIQGALVVKNPPARAGDVKASSSIPGWGRSKIPWRRKWPPTAIFLPGESYRQRSLVVYNTWGAKESDMTESLRHGMMTHRSQMG